MTVSVGASCREDEDIDVVHQSAGNLVYRQARGSQPRHRLSASRLSIACDVWRPSARHPDVTSFIKTANDHLYRAKHEGRNHVIG